MLDYFKSLIKKESPSYIKEFCVESADGLSVATCSWAKDDKYYRATSYFTDAWISSRPIGPGREEGRIGMPTLYDISDVQVFERRQLWEGQPRITADDLRSILFSLKKRLADFAKSALPPLEEGVQFEYKFAVSPYPVLIVVVREYSCIVGSFAITTDGDVKVIMAYSDSIYSYISKLHPGMLALPEVSSNSKVVEQIKFE